jgi:hypothetical protein
MLTLDKYLAYEKRMQDIFDGGVNIKTGESFDAKELEDNLDIVFEEFFTFQEYQARFHASGVISSEVAQIVYNALGGEVYDTTGKNGGWAEGVNLARKTSITQLMSELMTKGRSAQWAT